MSEPTEFPKQGVDEQKLARQRVAQALFESILTKNGIELDKFAALHQESEAEIQAKIAQQMAEVDAEAAAMRETVRREVENWRYTVEQLKTLTATAEPIQRILLDTAFDVTTTPGTTPGLTVDSTQRAPGNNSAKFSLRNNGPGATETVSFGFIWQNTSNRPAVVNVDGYFVFDGKCQALAFGGGIFSFSRTDLFVKARLKLQELWNQPPSSPMGQGGQDADVLFVHADPGTVIFENTVSVIRYLFRGFDLQYRQLRVPPQGQLRIEVSFVFDFSATDGQVVFTFNKDGQVLTPGVLIGVLPVLP
jgi:hypothetical protein